MINRACQNFVKSYRLYFTCLQKTSAQKQLINAPAPKYADNRTALKENIWRDIDQSGKVAYFLYKKSEVTHLSMSEQWIKKIPVMKVKHDVVRCLGGTDIGAGHPQVYIQLNTRTPGQPVSCKWCGLRYALDLDHHHH